MNKAKLIFSVFILLLGFQLTSCSKSPQKIDYGNDACHYCQMTIVDKIHGAELITDKRKVFKFDAAECLIRYKNELSESTEGYQFLSNYFETPEEFITLNEAKFLISESLPSPMGAYLTAFKTDETLVKIKEEKGGKIYNWDELDTFFKNK